MLNTFTRCANLVFYEWKRALAKKKFFVLVILTLALQIIVFLSFNYLFSNPPELLDVEELKTTMWLVGVLGPQELFMPLIAIVIAGGSMSEEYEQGTADVLLTKPIKKSEYMVGKYLGGFSLSSFVITLTSALGVALAYGFFGPQEFLLYVPLICLALVYANVLFFSLGFMFSEVLRRTTLAILAAIGIFVASMLIGGYLAVIYAMTQEEFYLTLSRWIPNWSVSNLPGFVASEFITVPTNPFLSVPSGDFQLAAAIIATYAVLCVVVTAIRLTRSDISKKAT
ncbi:MAG: ABC transporter permease [Candidatus Hodarchaeota archaeon]